MARPRISPVRNPRSFRRPPGHKAPRSITLIVCEGETEQEYFKALRMHHGLTTAEIVIAEDTKGSAPISVVNYAEEKAREPGATIGSIVFLTAIIMRALSGHARKFAT